MPADKIRLHPDAAIEIEATIEWYADRSLSSAVALLSELERAYGLIVENPSAWPNYLHKTRRFLLRRFPFSVVYRDIDDSILIIALAHGHRKPGYWQTRT